MLQETKHGMTGLQSFQNANVKTGLSAERLKTTIHRKKFHCNALQEAKDSMTGLQSFQNSNAKTGLNADGLKTSIYRKELFIRNIYKIIIITVSFWITLYQVYACSIVSYIMLHFMIPGCVGLNKCFFV